MFLLMLLTHFRLFNSRNVVFFLHTPVCKKQGQPTPVPAPRPAVVQHFALEDFSNTLDCMGDGVPVAHAVESTCRFGWDDPHPLPCRFVDRGPPENARRHFSPIRRRNKHRRYKNRSSQCAAATKPAATNTFNLASNAIDRDGLVYSRSRAMISKLSAELCSVQKPVWTNRRNGEARSVFFLCVGWKQSTTTPAVAFFARQRRSMCLSSAQLRIVQLRSLVFETTEMNRRHPRIKPPHRLLANARAGSAVLRAAVPLYLSVDKLTLAMFGIFISVTCC